MEFVNMNLWYVFAALAVISIISFIIHNVSYCFDDVWLIIGFVSTICGSVLLLICLVGTLNSPTETATFKSQKMYIESHQVDDPVENAALTNKKIELNEWLYTAQFNKNRFGNWSFYADEVLSLTPIE